MKGLSCEVRMDFVLYHPLLVFTEDHIKQYGHALIVEVSPPTASAKSMVTDVR